jgi:transposase
MCCAKYLVGSLSVYGNPLNPLNSELNPICHLLALLGAHHILPLAG